MRRVQRAAAGAATALRAGSLLAGELGAVVAVHRLGSAPGFALPHGDVGRWLRETPALDAMAALLRVLALVAAWWLLASTVWWLLVAARGAVRARRAPAMPGSRRLVEWVLALSLAGTVTCAGPAAGAATTPTTTTTTPALVLEHVDRRDQPPTTAPTATPGGVRTGRGGLAAVPAPAPAPAPAPPVAPAAPQAPAPALPVHVIAPGENLWTIAAAQVGARGGRSPDRVPAAEIAPYWRALCDLNRASIRSGNLSLVYPGEVLQLPG